MEARWSWVRTMRMAKMCLDVGFTDRFRRNDFEDFLLWFEDSSACDEGGERKLEEKLCQLWVKLKYPNLMRNTQSFGVIKILLRMPAYPCRGRINNEILTENRTANTGNVTISANDQQCETCEASLSITFYANPSPVERETNLKLLETDY